MKPRGQTWMCRISRSVYLDPHLMYMMLYANELILRHPSLQLSDDMNIVSSPFHMK